MSQSAQRFLVAVLLAAAPTAAYGQGQFSDWAAIQSAIGRVPITAGTVYDTNNWTTNHIKVYNFHVLANDGPHDVSFSLNRIRGNYHYNSHANDGSIFTNTQNYVPHNNNPNYYHEFVEWPSLDTSIHPYNVSSFVFPGPMRLILGYGGELYFSGDHYGSDGLAPYVVSPVPEPTGPLVIAAVLVCGLRRGSRRAGRRITPHP